MSPVFDRTDFIYNLTHKGFSMEPTGSGHIGLFLLDERNRRTGVRTGVPMGSHGRTLGPPYIKRMAKHLHITMSDLDSYQACNHSHGWLLDKLRSDGYIRN